MTLTPAVPGAINISSLTGEEIVQLQSGGQSTAQTTTQDIANLGGGGGGTGPTGPTGSGATGPAGATGPTGSGGGGSSVVLSTGKISLTSAQLLALFSDPVTIIPAPGAGKMIQVVAAIYELIYGSTTYEGSDGTQGLYYETGESQNAADNFGSQSNNLFQNTANAVASSFGLVSVYDTAGIVPTEDVENQPVVLSSTSADMTTGNGTGAITVIYSVVTL